MTQRKAGGLGARLSIVLLHSIRGWLRTPLIALTAALSLGLGIGATTTFFSVLDHFILRPLAVSSPHDLVAVGTASDPLGRFPFPVWNAIRDRSDLYAGAYAWATTAVNIAPRGEVDSVNVALASGGVFRTLGVSAALGRVFDERDDAREGGPDGLVAVISHRWWQQRFRSDPAVVGQTISVEGTPFTIVGVAPDSLPGLRSGTAFDLMLPLGTEPHLRAFSLVESGRMPFLTIVMRLAPGVGAAAAAEALRADQPRIRAAARDALLRPEDRDGVLPQPLTLTPAPDGGAGLVAYYARTVTTLFGLSILVLAACCGNVAAVILAHGATRHQELSVRAALGASRWRTAGHLLADSAVLAVTGAVLGLFLAVWSGPWVVGQWNAARFDTAVAVTTNWKTWALAAATAVACSLLCGGAAAWRAARVGGVDALTRRTHTGAPVTHQVIAAAQLAFSVVVVVAGALLMRNYVAITLAPALGQVQDVVAIELRVSGIVPPAGVDEDTADRVRREVAAAVPGAVTSISTSVPFASGVYFWGVDGAGGASSPARDRMAVVDSVTPAHFDVLAVPLVSGRRLGGQDAAGAPPVAVVNRTFATRFLDGDLRLPRFVRFDGGDREHELSVVGIVEDLPYENVTSATDAVVYLPRRQHVIDGSPVFVVVRPRAGTTVPADAVRRALASAAPELSYRLAVLPASARAQFARERMLAVVAAGFAGIGILMGGLGLFGVMSHGVTMRQREIGVRLALGALPRQVTTLVLRTAAIVVVAGASAGVVLAWWAANLLRSLLVAVDVHDIGTFASAALALATTALVAAWWPARRASRVDPGIVLRAG
ncbi:MAG: ABC transporter permease [Vicinamibacterales bacterium]